MTPDERLTEVFDRGFNHGEDVLSRADHELFLIQEFILDYEMSALGGYFSNRLPDLDRIVSMVQAMKVCGLPSLAELLGEAVAIFNGYSDPDPPTTWSEVLQRYDPTNRLDELHDRIRALDNYGLADSSIT
jgi:hypothetical protein